MKAVLLTLIFAVLFVGSNGADIWSSVPGLNNDAKINNLVSGVLLARQWIESRICTHQAFAEPPAADDNSTVVNWAAFLCGLWGGPANTTELCTYYRGGGRTEPDNILAANFAQFYSDFHADNFPSTSTRQYETVRDALVYAIRAAGSGNDTFVTAAINDFDTNLRPGIVSDNATAASAACPTTTIIGWSNPINIDRTVAIDEIVTFVWNDSLSHSVQSTTSGFIFPGMGGESLTLSKETNCQGSFAPNTGCVVQDTGFFNYTYQFRVPGTEYTFVCPIHPGMTGRIVVAQLDPTTSTGSVSTTTGCVGVGCPSSDESSISESSASALSSWLALF